MNGVHDMGGMHGFGTVLHGADEPPFHAAWEGRVMGLVPALLFTGVWSLDRFRHLQEQLPAVRYLGASYFERWLLALTQGALEAGLVTADELAAGRALEPGRSLARTLTPALLGFVLKRGSPARPAPAPARFRPGDRVRTLNLHPEGHTRLPRYARDKTGTVVRVLGCDAYPDRLLAGQPDAAAWLYTVEFTGTALWGTAADPALVVSIDAFEPYLEPA